MKKIIFAAALLFCAYPASAATFCITAQSSADPAPMQYCETTADANLGYFIAAMAAKFFPSGVATSATATRAPTAQEIMNMAGHRVWQEKLDDINTYLAAQAVSSAPKVQ